MKTVAWKVTSPYCNTGVIITKIPEKDINNCETEQQHRFFIEKIIKKEFEDKLSYHILNVVYNV